MKPTLVQPYLVFGGRCEDALAFYQKALGAKVELMMRFSESPVPVPPDRIPAGFENKIMHCTFHIGEATVMATDGCEAGGKFEGISLSLALPAEADAQRAFAALSEGGKVEMPLGKTFWSPCFGMVADRFGVSWMVTVNG